MLNGMNHLTLAVVDLQSSIKFYTNVLGMNLQAEWDHGAYLSVGEFWVCLSLDPKRTGSHRSLLKIVFDMLCISNEIFDECCSHSSGLHYSDCSCREKLRLLKTSNICYGRRNGYNPPPTLA